MTIWYPRRNNIEHNFYEICMSKEKLNTSSINVPEEGVKNVAEDNKLKSSINTPERVEPLEAVQTKAS